MTIDLTKPAAGAEGWAAAIAANLAAIADAIDGAPAPPGLFGDGSDGDATISSNTSLTSDAFYKTLTVESGVTLSTDGFRLFASERVTVASGGRIANDGGDGGPSSGGQGAPGSGFANGGGGGYSFDGNDTFDSLGGDGADGASTAGGTADPPDDQYGTLRATLPAFSATLLTGEAGGFNAQVGVGAGGGGGSGGGGGGGGGVLVAAPTLVLEGTVSANGGDGDGTGGGGGGGVVILAYGERTGGGSAEASGGAGGGGGGDGTVIELTP